METILQKIEDAVLEDSIKVLSVEFAKDSIRVKVEEFNNPAITYKCVNKPDVNFGLAYQELKPLVNDFKQYALPNETDLEYIFLREREERFRNISEEDFTEEAEKKLKEEVFSRPSIEKIFIKSIEYKSEMVDNSQVFYYQLKIVNKNIMTLCSEEDQLVLYANFVPKQIKDHKTYELFQAKIDSFFAESKKFYLDFLEELKTKREEKKRLYILEASQGNLFPDLEEYDKKLLTKQAKEYFPEKFKGSKVIMDLEQMRETEEFLNGPEKEYLMENMGRNRESGEEIDL